MIRVLDLPRPSAFHVMIKPGGAICNLKCRYCYYLPKERLYPGSAFQMTDAILEEYTRQYISAQHVPEVTFGWQGGEPLLMGLGFFRRALELQSEYRKPGMHVLNTLQTNGTLLDDEWCKFFRTHHFLVGVSLDGPRALHDAYRVDRGAAPTFDRVMRGIALLKKHKVDFNLLTSVHAANADYPVLVYHFLRDHVGARFIQFIPIVERDGAGEPEERVRKVPLSVTGERFGRFLIAVFDEWVRRDVGRVYVQMFDVALNVWYGRHAGLCVFEETCGNALALEHNGDLYACDHFVESDYKLGNIHQRTLAEMGRCNQQRQFGGRKQGLLPQYCRDCEVRFMCNGGCPKDRILVTPDGEPGLNFLCAGFKAFFKHIDKPMTFMAQELRKGRAPANIMVHKAPIPTATMRRRATGARKDSTSVR